jgi:hypothetical protein
MHRNLVGCAAASVLALTVGVTAQNPPSTPQTQPPTRQPAAQEQPMVTVEGCLMREQDVPGRKPNVAERAGVAEDYILANAKVVKGTAPKGTVQPKAGEPTGTSGKFAPMYDVKGINDEQLKPLAGKRVQIEGRFADVDKTPPPAGQTEDLVDIRGTTIRAAKGECPAK